MGSVFESIQAILKEEASQYLRKRDIFIKLKSFIDSNRETLEVFESQNGPTTLIGSLKAILICQEFLSSFSKEGEDLRVKFNMPEIEASSKYSESEIPRLHAVPTCEANSDFIVKDTVKWGPQPKPEITSHNIEVNNNNRTNDLELMSSIPRNQESNIHQSSNHISTLYPSTRGNIRVTTSVINVLPKYFCDSCPFTSSKEKLYQKHLKYHKKKDDTHSHIYCASCHEEFAHVSEYEVHLKNKHKDQKERPVQTFNNSDNVNENNLKCPTRGNEAQSARKLKKHLDSHHPAIYTCAQCGYETKKKMHYVRHIKNVHENVRPFTCKVCGLAFKRQDSLRQHQFIHSREAKTEDRFQCDVCNKVFRSSSYLREHMLTHSNVRSYLCEMCGSAFKTRAVHRNHMKVVHSGTLQAACKICGKTFSTKYSLKRHVLQHERKTEDWNTDAHIEKNGSYSDDVKSKPSNKQVDLIASAWANASCTDDSIIETVYTGMPSDNFNLSIDNQIPYIVHSAQEILTE